MLEFARHHPELVPADIDIDPIQRELAARFRSSGKGEAIEEAFLSKWYEQLLLEYRNA